MGKTQRCSDSDFLCNDHFIILVINYTKVINYNIFLYKVAIKQMNLSQQPKKVRFWRTKIIVLLF